MPPIPTDFDTELAHFTPRQMEAIGLLDSGLIKFLLYGGALGGGKSYFLRWYGLRRLIELGASGFPHATAMLACEDYPTLKDRQLSKIPREFPRELGEMHQDHKEYGRCFILAPEYGSGVLCFRNLDDPSKYQSSEWVLILVDELTKNVYDTFTQLTMRLRWPGLPDSECQFVGGTNPGGIGHGWVKGFWIEKLFPEEWIAPVDYRSTFAFVPSKADDNPHLPASYWDGLNRLPDTLRAAYRDGSWDIFLGQAFPNFSELTHGVDPVWPVPPFVPLYMTFDWGFGKPFSVGWWWIDSDGRPMRFAEWYGASGHNEGLRLSDTKIAEGIVEREVTMGLCRLAIPEDLTSGVWQTPIMRHSGFDCFAKRPDYKMGGTGPTTAETFARFKIVLNATDSKRETKIRQFRERLEIGPAGQPNLLVYKTCTDFFRTIRDLVMDKMRPEDVDTKGEDHQYDEACHICMVRPLAGQGFEQPLTGPARIIQLVERGPSREGDELPWRQGADSAIVAGYGPQGGGFLGQEEW